MIIPLLTLAAMAVWGAAAYWKGRNRGYWDGFYQGMRLGRVDGAPIRAAAPRRAQPCIAERALPPTEYEKAQHVRVAAMFPDLTK